MAERFVDRQSAYPNRYKITRADGSTEYVTLERADDPSVEGTPLNAEVFNEIIDELAATVPTTRGGTGAQTGDAGLKNLLASGPMILSSHQYGDTLPDPGIPGRIFFKKVSG